MAEKEKEEKTLFIYCTLKSLLTALLLTALLLLIISAVYLAADIKEEACRALITASAVFSVFLSSVSGGRRIRKQGIFLGAANGILYTLVLYLTGFLAFGFPGMGKGVIATAALSALAGALGGIIGVNIRAKNAKRRR